MTPRKDNFPHPDPPVRSPSLQGVHPHAAAIESGAAEQGVAVPPTAMSHPSAALGRAPSISRRERTGCSPVTSRR